MGPFIFDLSKKRNQQWAPNTALLDHVMRSTRLSTITLPDRISHLFDQALVQMTDALPANLLDIGRTTQSALQPSLERLQSFMLTSSTGTRAITP